MPIWRAAAEIDPVRPMRSTSSALPGPSAAVDVPSTRNVRPRYRAMSPLSVGKEKLFAADLIPRDHGLALGGYHPVDERLAQFFLHVRVLGRVHEHDAVLVEQALV